MIRLKATFLCCSLLLAAAFTGCAADTAASSAPEPEKPSPSVQTTAQAEATTTAVTELRIQAGDRVFTAQLEDTPAAQALAAAMPMTWNMDEMNGNEKYFFLSDALSCSVLRKLSERLQLYPPWVHHGHCWPCRRPRERERRSEL